MDEEKQGVGNPFDAPVPGVSVKDCPGTGVSNGLPTPSFISSIYFSYTFADAAIRFCMYAFLAY